MPHHIYTTTIPAKIFGCSLWSRSLMLGSAERRKHNANQLWNYSNMSARRPCNVYRHVTAPYKLSSYCYYYYVITISQHVTAWLLLSKFLSSQQKCVNFCQCPHRHWQKPITFSQCHFRFVTVDKSQWYDPQFPHLIYKQENTTEPTTMMTYFCEWLWRSFTMSGRPAKAPSS